MKHLPLFLLASLAPVSLYAADTAAIDLGSRRELLVDDFLIATMEGAALKMHKPEAREVVITCDEPWEGNVSAYYTIFKDGDIYRMYYRGGHVDEKMKPTHRELVCYAESRDGITWTKPKLGLFEYNGSKDNNIVRYSGGTHNFTPFKDTHPGCKPEARYKAVASGGTNDPQKKGTPGLQAYQSPDGIHWSLMQEAQILDSKVGAYDSQNLAFYDPQVGAYRAYWRWFHKKQSTGPGPGGVRDIRTATSKDFIHWENQADLTYGDAPEEHLYTNAIMPYERAPHLYVGFPTRFEYKHQQVEPIFMSSRDGVNFKRWPEALIPITAPKDRDGNRSNYMTRALLFLPGNEREMSVYATEAYYKGPGARVRRFTFRTDGFVSAHADAAGSLTTKPFTFAGSKLVLNIASKGDTRVEVRDAAGKTVPGFGLADCTAIKADDIEHTVQWKGGSLSSLAGKAVTLHFQLDQADLYGLRFAE